MPFDWQFVVVTVVALGAASVIVCRFVPGPRAPQSGRPPDPSCAHCASNREANRPARTETTQVVLIRDLRK